MINSISSSNISAYLASLQSQSKPTGSDMFSKLSEELGITDGSDITSDQLDDYINQIESSDSEDKGKLGFLKQLQSNFDTIAGDDGTISSSDMENNIELLKPPTQGGAKVQGVSSDDMYAKLLQDLGLEDGDEISEDTLDSYIEDLEENGSAEEQEKLGFLKQLQENFDTIADDDGTISATDLNTNFNLLQPPSMSGSSSIITDWLDPSEITSEMLQSPIDLKV